MRDIVEQCRQGIHTYSVFLTLTAKEYYAIRKACQTLRSYNQEYWTERETYHIDELSAHGLKLYLSRISKLYTLKIRIEPCLVLKSKNPAALYVPTKKSYCALVKTADKRLKHLDIPRSIDEMKLCRADWTVDLYFKEKACVLSYVRILQNSFVMPHYKRVRFKTQEKKAKNHKEANRHSYRLLCKSATFSAYDKIAQLQMTNRFTDTLN